MTTALNELETPIAAEHSTANPHRRVLHVINGEHYSGAERVQDLLAAALPAEGFDVGFACVKPRLFPFARKAKSVPLYDFAMGSRFDVRAAFRMARLIKQEQYELVHAHTPRSVFVGRLAAALARVPLVYHVHSPTSRDSTRALRNRLNHWSERISLLGTSALLPVSASLARHMIASGYSESIVHTVPNGVPAPAIKRSSAPPRDVWTLGIVALFRPRKGLEVLLDALAMLTEDAPRIRLLAIGPFETAQYEQEIMQRVRELSLDGSIEWTGFTSDVPSELRRLDVLVLPSLFGEGLPMVVLEAMAAGVPVIASEVEGVPEVIDDGTNGLLAKPGDAAHLARCIRRVVDREIDWSLLRDQAIQTHGDCFSDRIMAARVARIYRQLLQPS